MYEVPDGGIETKEVALSQIDLRTDSCSPKSKRAVSEAALREIVRGTRRSVLVRPMGDRYELVVGDLEYWVARARGEKEIACWIKDMDDMTAILTRVSEGARRKDINPVEEAIMISRLASEYGMTHKEIAMRCGRRQCTISNKLRLLRLPGLILETLKKGGIGERQARALLMVTGEKRQMELFMRCVKMGLSAREMEELCRLSSGKKYAKSLVPVSKHKIIYKDPRIFVNTLRKVVGEMKKAGLDVVCIEDMFEEFWEFKVLVKV